MIHKSSLVQCLLIRSNPKIFSTLLPGCLRDFLSILTAISSRNELLQTFGNEVLQTFGNEVLQTFNKRKMLSSNSRYCTLQESPAWHSGNPGFMDFCSYQFEARLKSGFTGPSFPGSRKNLQWSKRAKFQSRVLLWFFHWQSRL